LQRTEEKPDKPTFLKDLKTYVDGVRMSIVENILLVDDNLYKILLSDPHNIVLPQSLKGDKEDNYFSEHLCLWLDHLFKSNKVVLHYVKNHPLVGCQSPKDLMSSEGLVIVKGLIQV